MPCPLYAGGNCGPTVTTVVSHVVSHVVPAVGGSLAFTGGDAIAALIVGGSLLIGGLALAWKGRRREEKEHTIHGRPGY